LALTGTNRGGVPGKFGFTKGFKGSPGKFKARGKKGGFQQTVD